MGFFGYGFIVATGAIHEALMEDAVSHAKGMAYLMIDNFLEKLDVSLGLILGILLFIDSEIFDDHLFERHDTSSIFDGAEAKDPFLLQKFLDSISIIN